MPAFLTLSLELNQMIALLITDDEDLRNYRLSCRIANDAADGDGGTFWRKRFLSHYDPLLKRVPNLDYKRRYIQRQLRLYTDPQSKKAKSGYERKSLEVIRELMLGSFTAGHDLTSKNMEKLHTFVNRTGLLDKVFQKRPHGTKSDFLLYTVQLMLAHISLNSGLSTPSTVTLRFPESQQMAYSSAATYPIFDPVGQIDLKWTLHLVNFFKYHLRRESEQLCAPYSALIDFERPQCWSKMLQNGPLKLGKHWKGCYTFVDRSEMAIVRTGRNEEDYVVQDQINGEDSGDGFQDLSLNFPTGGSIQWPDTFEKILQSCGKPLRSAKTRAQKRASGSLHMPTAEPISFRFEGEGKDNSEPFLAVGWLNPLPPQQGVPGWQRMTMMKYYVEKGDPTSPMFALEDSLWAYEGVVLPGGMIIVGRWWHPQSGTRLQDQYSGPFILWNVDKSVVSED